MVGLYQQTFYLVLPVDVVFLIRFLSGYKQPYSRDQMSRAVGR